MKASAALLTIVLTAFVGIFALLSCTREDPFVLDEDDVRSYAEARCLAELECCGAPAELDCAESLTSMVLGFGTTVDADLTFSEACIEDLLVYAQSIGCDRDAVDSPRCRLAVGRGTHGDECEEADDDVAFYMTTCRDGLSCVVGRCVDAVHDGTNPAGLGENCSASISCGTGLYCGSDFICQEKVPQDEVCMEGQVCENGLYCNGYLDGQGVCEERLGPGDECDPRYERACGYRPNGEYSSELTYCIDGVCAFYEGSPLCEGML